MQGLRPSARSGARGVTYRMTIDTIAARNKRIKHLEAQRADDAATIKGLVKRVQAAEAKLARAERLAEAAFKATRGTHHQSCYRARFPRDIGARCGCGFDELLDALDAFRSTEPQPAADGEGKSGS